MNSNVFNGHFDPRSIARQTAWDCPHLLTEADWHLAHRTVQALEAFDLDSFEEAIGRNLVGYFERVIGWPEGARVFALGTRSVRRFHFVGLVSQVLPRLKSAVQARNEPLARTG